jgi:hypothetical protein
MFETRTFICVCGRERVACVRVCAYRHIWVRESHLNEHSTNLCSTAISAANELFSRHLKFASFEMKETRCGEVQFCGVLNDAVSVTGIT